MYKNISILLLLLYSIQSQKIDLFLEEHYCFGEKLLNPQSIEYKIQNSTPSVNVEMGIIYGLNELKCVNSLVDEVKPILDIDYNDSIEFDLLWTIFIFLAIGNGFLMSIYLMM